MSTVNEENKGTVQHDLASIDIYSTYLWSKDVTDEVAGTAEAIKTRIWSRNGPNGSMKEIQQKYQTTSAPRPQNKYETYSHLWDNL